MNEPASAILSDDGTYRYRLDRLLSPHGHRWVTFVMLNPSTADAEQDDPTIRKCRGFAQRWECTGLTVVNLFAFRATDPHNLGLARRNGVDVIGPDNPMHVTKAIRESDLVVAAWGSRVEQWLWAGRQVALFFQTYKGTKIHRIGPTVGHFGQPRHPLMAPYSLGLEELAVWRG